MSLVVIRHRQFRLAVLGVDSATYSQQPPQCLTFSEGTWIFDKHLVRKALRHPWITQFNLQTTLCLTLAFVYIYQMAPP